MAKAIYKFLKTGFAYIQKSVDERESRKKR
jgi:hypothetical protein